MKDFTTATSGPFRRLLSLALLSLCLAVPAVAATVQVTVVDENAAPVGRARVFLREGGKANALGEVFRSSRYGETDASGRAQFDDLQPGHYVLGARTPEMSHGKDEDNPLAPRVELTIDSPDQVVQVQLELHRGTQLCTRFVIEGSRLDARGKVSRKELESGYTTEKGLRREEDLCEPLFAGRWELKLDPPGGYVLVDLDVNGVSTVGNTAMLDVRPGSKSQNVTWYLVALAQLEGKVYFESDRFGVMIHADLIQAGDWLAQAEARGGSLYAPVQTHPDPRGNYVVDLPDGLWRIQPVGEDLEEADPEMVEVRIARGETYRQDFTVRGKSSGFQPGLRVRVRSPNGDSVADAVVEVWPGESELRGERPLVAERTTRWGTAQIKGLQAGSYRLVAGHPGYREGTHEIEFDPEDDKTRSQQVRLQRAADLKVRLDADEEHDPTGGAIELTREGGSIVSELADETLLNKLRHPRAEFDATHRAWVPGIYAGTYRVAGVHDHLLFEFKQNGRWVEEPEITFTDGQPRELEARVVPAATIAGQLNCVGGEPMPGNVEVRVVPAGTPLGDPLDISWQTETVLVRQPLLGGERRDAFQVGPLPPAVYFVAIQPATFDRWTWAYGSENGADAQSFPAKRGETIELGAIAVDCGPVVRVSVRIGSGGDVPNLDGTRWERDLLLQAVVTTNESHEYELDSTDLEPYARLLMLRGLREGEISGEISLRHDHFLPDPWVHASFHAELSRGGTLDVVLSVDDVGGALQLNVASSPGAIARLVDAQGNERSASIENDRANIPNLPVGTYLLDVCAEPACATLLRATEMIEIELLKTLELRRTSAAR